MTQKGLFIGLSGPSGVGKGTIIQMLKKSLPQVQYVLSHTTRAIRKGEKDGEQYHFVSEDEFKKGIDAGDFIEWAQVHAQSYYGILKAPVEKALAEGKVIVREVDVQGARLIRKALPKDQTLMIFLKPESMAFLKAHIDGRSDLPADEVARRLASAEVEMAAAGEFDYQIINYEGRPMACFLDVEGIIRSRIESMGIILT